MKTSKLYLYLFLMLLPSTLSAQVASKDSLSNGYLFKDFTDGFVMTKDGNRTAAKLNYYCIQGLMLFKNAEDVVMEFAVPGDVEAVTINDRYFVNSNKNAFYEVIEVGKTCFYIQWMGKIISEGKGGGTGYGYSATSATTSLYGQLRPGGSKLKNDEKFITKTECNYFVKIKNTYKSINNLSMLKKAFKGHEQEIDNFAIEQNIDFNQPSHIAKIIEFCSKFNL